MTEILHDTLPYDPFDQRRLPGIQPMQIRDWLPADEAFGAQMAERARLLRLQRADVLQLSQRARPAAQELLSQVRDHLYPGSLERIVRPDGVAIDLDWEDPMGTLGHVTQQDFCILEKPEGAAEHVLTAAVLCFPASWRLSEKFMRPLTDIHIPVDSYDAGLAARVQRLFDGVQVGRPLWRFNALWYKDPTLYQPRSREAVLDLDCDGQSDYLRSEWQSILRLPETRAVVFSIHTRVVPRERVMAQFGRAMSAE